MDPQPSSQLHVVVEHYAREWRVQPRLNRAPHRSNGAGPPHGALGGQAWRWIHHGAGVNPTLLGGLGVGGRRRLGEAQARILECTPGQPPLGGQALAVGGGAAAGRRRRWLKGRPARARCRIRGRPKLAGPGRDRGLQRR